MSPYISRRLILLSVLLLLIPTTGIGRSTYAMANVPMASPTVELADTLQSPRLVPTGTPPPPGSASNQIPQEPAIAMARQYIAGREQVLTTTLQVVSDYPLVSTILNRQFRGVTLFDTQRQQFFKVLVDNTSQEVREVRAFEEEEQRAYKGRYGNLAPGLATRLQSLGSNDLVSVVIVVAPAAGQRAEDIDKASRAAVIRQFPDAEAALRKGLNLAMISNADLRTQVWRAYQTSIKAALQQRSQPLIKRLAAQNLKATVVDGLPALIASLPKRAILDLANDPAILHIGQLPQQGRPQALASIAAPLMQAVPPRTTGYDAVKAPAVWARGIDGTGVRVAMVDTENVAFTVVNPITDSYVLCPSGNNCFAHPGSTRNAGALGLAPSYGDDHPTITASQIAASGVTDPHYRGVAPGVTIDSAGLQNSVGDYRWEMMNGVNWALTTANSNIVNMSVGTCAEAGSDTDAPDWAASYSARYYNRLIVVASGDTFLCGDDEQVMSPARARNLLTVGGYNHYTGQFEPFDNTHLVPFSSWENPPASYYEKPELAAPGKNTNAIRANGVVKNDAIAGTSLSAPLVSGVAALLIQRNALLTDMPNALKAILMATAVENIDGPSGMPAAQDVKDGAGAVNADLADQVAQTQALQSTVCSVGCWWHETITPASFDTAGKRIYRFTANAGDRVRVSANWWAAADAPTDPSWAFTPDRLAADLDMYLRDPDGNIVYGSISASGFNNFELIPNVGDRGANGGELMITKSGEYQIVISKYSFNEETNQLGVAWTKLPPRAPARSIWDDATIPSVTSDSNCKHVRAWDEVPYLYRSPRTQPISRPTILMWGTSHSMMATSPMRALRMRRSGH